MTTTDDMDLGLSDQHVASYLRERPDFFVRHPGLLSELELPHEAGEAISLVQRQVAILRERNIETRNRLRDLLDAAGDNDRLFEQTRTLTLALLDANSVPAVDKVLSEALVDGFQADCAHCCIVGPDDLATTHISTVADVAALPLAHLIRDTGIACGALRADELATLFPEADLRSGSAAVIALSADGITGQLAIGSQDPHRFSPEMGTLFVRFIGDVLARVLSRVLRQ